jgi:flavin reductase
MTHIDLYKQGMRRLAASVSIITTLEGAQPRGFAATSVTSVCAHPMPMLLVCVNKGVSCYEAMLAHGGFCVNVLRDDADDTAQLFSTPDNRDQRFLRCDWQALVTGSPALTQAISTFDCHIRSVVDAHSHSVIFGEVTAIQLGGESIDPLIYVNGGFDRLRSSSTGSVEA